MCLVVVFQHPFRIRGIDPAWRDIIWARNVWFLYDSVAPSKGVPLCE
jgi:hypothetical protein